MVLMLVRRGQPIAASWECHAFASSSRPQKPGFEAESNRTSKMRALACVACEFRFVKLLPRICVTRRQKMHRPKPRSAFSLVDFLVVIGIIAVLMALSACAVQ